MSDKNGISMLQENQLVCGIYQREEEELEEEEEEVGPWLQVLVELIKSRVLLLVVVKLWQQRGERSSEESWIQRERDWMWHPHTVKNPRRNFKVGQRRQGNRYHWGTGGALYLCWTSFCYHLSQKDIGRKIKNVGRDYVFMDVLTP